MGDFDLDLGAIERDMNFEGDPSIILGVLDGQTSDDEWIDEFANGNVLVLAIEGDISELASGIATPIKDAGGSLVHFRDFLIVSPPNITTDMGRLD